MQWTTKICGAEFRIQRLQEPELSFGALDTPRRFIEYLAPKLADSVVYRSDVENFIVIYLNTRLCPIGFNIVTTGTLDTLLVHPREVFKGAIISNASCIILCHNHPSGDPSPSEADIKVTRDLVKAGAIMRIEVKDHIILGRQNTFRSLREDGFFYQ
jgi:DNA repair protein RadC